MKKLIVFLSGFLVLVLSYSSNAQSTTGADYFSGKWNVLLKGIPGGDRKLHVVLDKKDSTINGVVQDTVGNEIAKITKTELKETELTIYFHAEGHDVSLLMIKKDEDSITGSLLAMFEAEGVRIKDKINKDKSNK